MNLVFKDENNTKFDYVIKESLFALTDRMRGDIYCEEYDIIKKIRLNREGFFDFSKSLIDVGSEDGNYAMLLDFNKNYCFEPNKRMCCLIYTNMYLRNKVYNTEVYNIALGEQDNEEVLYNGFAQEGSGLYKDSMHRAENGVQKIKKMTLDSFNIENVGLIKTDTEGFDLSVLKGGLQTIIKNGYPPILFENWKVGWCGQTKEKMDSCFNFIYSLGYDIFMNWGDHETHLAVKKK